jgi:hypothetical protein
MINLVPSSALPGFVHGARGSGAAHARSAVDLHLK